MANLGLKYTVGTVSVSGGFTDGRINVATNNKLRVTACLAAVVTSLLFPNGFLIDVPTSSPTAAVATTIPPALATTEPRQDPTTTGATPPDNDQPAAFGWRASVSCSVSLDDIDEVERPE